MLKELLGEKWTQEIEDLLKGKVELVGSEQKIPKERFDQVNNEKKELQTEVDKLMQKVTEFSKSTETIENLKTQLTETKTNYDSYVENAKIEKVNNAKKAALLNYLDNENVLNPELLIPYYPLDELTFDGDKLVGVTAKTESLRTKFKDQFGEVKTKSPPIKSEFKGKSFKDLNLNERTKFKQEDPNGYEIARKAHFNK